MDRVDATVHLAGIPHEDSFDRILETNVVGTYNVYQAARKQGCPRVVLASSLHVTGFYDASERISPRMPVRPDSFYGVSKACGESLGRLYADKHGLQVVCVRIGTFAERPTALRHLSTWLSPRRRGAVLALPGGARHRVHRGVRDLGDPAWLVGPRPGRAARLPAHG